MHQEKINVKTIQSVIPYLKIFPCLSNIKSIRFNGINTQIQYYDGNKQKSDDEKLLNIIQDIIKQLLVEASVSNADFEKMPFATHSKWLIWEEEKYYIKLIHEDKTIGPENMLIITNYTKSENAYKNRRKEKYKMDVHTI